MKYIVRLLILAGLFTWGSCNHLDDLEGLEARGGDAEYAVALVNTQATLQDLLENLDDYTFIDVDDDNLIRLRYKGNLVTKTSQEIFQNIEAALPPLIPVLDTVMVLPFTTPEGIEIDYVEMKTGTLQYVFVSDHEEDLTIDVKFPGVKKPNGEILTFSHTANYGGSVPVVPFPPLVTYDLAGHTLEANEDGELTIEYEAFGPDGIRDTVSNFNIALTNVEFTYAEGYFGNQLHDGERDTILIEFFESWTQGDVYFEDPKIFVNVFNSFGVPTRSIVNVFDIYTATGDVLPLQADAIEDGIDFDYPELGEEGQERITEFTFTKDNSNIAEVLGSKPVALDYDVDAITNPDNETAIRGFITDSSRYSVQVEVELPIFGRASGFVAIDTIDLNFGTLDNVESVEFKVVSDNALPVNVDMQAYFMDPMDVVLDSLFDMPTALIEAAPADSEGETTGTTTSEYIIPVDAQRFDLLRASDRLILNVAFSTTNEGTQSVKIYADQAVEIRMGMKVKTIE